MPGVSAEELTCARVKRPVPSLGVNRDVHSTGKNHYNDSLGTVTPGRLWSFDDGSHGVKVFWSTDACMLFDLFQTCGLQ